MSQPRQVLPPPPSHAAGGGAGRPARRLSWVLVAALVVGAVVVLALRFGQPSPPADEAAPPGPASPFVQRSGTRLVADGRLLRFTGYNNYVMTGCGLPEERLDDAGRDRFFAALRPDSVVRFFVSPGSDLGRVDAVVGSARRHGQRVIPILSDGQGNCGDTKKDEAFYRDGYRGAYLDWVRTVVPRYAADPTIAMWELMNEPVDAPAPTLRAFFDEAGGLVHQLAPRHLVTSGTLQPDTYGGREAFELMSASPGIDVLSLHEYDAVPAMSVHADPALRAARFLDKPLLVGEWGLMANPAAPQDTVTEDGDPCYTLPNRRDVAAGKLTAYLAEPAVAGALVWSYQAGQAPSCTLATSPGDPLLDLVHDIEIPHRE